jgi:hypothetical protein
MIDGAHCVAQKLGSNGGSRYPRVPDHIDGFAAAAGKRSSREAVESECICTAVDGACVHGIMHAIPAGNVAGSPQINLQGLVYLLLWAVRHCGLLTT